MSSLVCSCFVFILCFWFSFGKFYAHVHYLDCCIWVLCHHNQCEPTAARMVHAQRCVYAAAVIWLRIYWGISILYTYICVCVYAQQREIRLMVNTDPSHFPAFIIESLHPARRSTELSLNADEHASVILSSKTALLWLLSFFFPQTLECPTVVHLQWSLTSCIMWYDSMQSKGSWRSDFCLELTTLIRQPGLLQSAVHSYATVLH